jgi:hypothetical protein
MSTSQCGLLMLVRAAPGSARAAAALARIEALVGDDCPAALVFFHGPAVALASGEEAERWSMAARAAKARLWVCASAWQRRFQTEPGPAFEVSSLVRFWSEALACGRIECFGDDQ